MKRLLLYIIAGSFILICIDMLCGVLFRKLLRSLPDNETFLSYMYQNLFEKKSDVLIIGASQVKYGYDTEVFNNILNMKCHNAGWAGYGIPYYQTIIEENINRHKPKLVVIDINSPYLNGSYRYQNTKMKCWYVLSSSVKGWMDHNCTTIEKVKIKSNLYKYNRIPQQLIRTYNMKIQHPNGFEPLYSVLNQKTPTITESFQLDSTELKMFEEIVSLTKKNNVTLIVSQAPSFEYDAKFNVWWADYLAQHNITFLNHSTDTFYLKRPYLFSDKWHLNHKGAKIYSESLALKCREILSAKHESN